MTPTIQSILQQAGLKASPFAPTSRYYGTELSTLITGNGTTIAYLKRRFVPSADSFQLLQEYQVTQGDRPDTIASVFLGDPERFWQICDANNVIDPEELTDNLGERIRITLPQGIPGLNA